MKISIILLYLSALLSSINILGTNETVSICTPKDLQCEYLFNPIGIDDVAPRLSWRLNDSRQGAFQSAYNIVVGTDSLAVLQGVGNMWNTAMVSDSSMLATYLGKELQPYAKYFWAVQLWDKDGVKGSLSQVASFETGLMRQENWQGKWICDVEDIKLKPAPYFRKEFSASKEIVGARAYITAAGLFELFINGKRVGDQVLDPAYTRFDKRNLYITHDVTHLVKESNAIDLDGIDITNTANNGIEILDSLFSTITHTTLDSIGNTGISISNEDIILLLFLLKRLLLKKKSGLHFLENTDCIMSTLC